MACPRNRFKYTCTVMVYMYYFPVLKVGIFAPCWLWHFEATQKHWTVGRWNTSFSKEGKVTVMRAALRPVPGVRVHWYTNEKMALLWLRELDHPFPALTGFQGDAWPQVLCSLVPRPQAFPVLRVLGTHETRARGKI